jgi:hypothetical protein
VLGRRIFQALWVLGVFAIGVILTSLVVDSLTREKPASGLLVHTNDEGANGRAEQLAISIVLGQTRSDGLSYFEFVVRRFHRLCPANKTSPKYLQPIAGATGPTVDGAYVWTVSFMVLGPRCAPIPTNPFSVANVWSDNGEVQGKRIGTLLARDAEHRLLRQQPVPDSSWLQDFRAGNSP